MLNTRCGTSEKADFSVPRAIPGGRIGWGWFRFASLLSSCVSILMSSNSYWPGEAIEPGEELRRWIDLVVVLAVPETIISCRSPSSHGVVS